MDTSGYDVTQIWIGEEAPNQTGEFLQSTHGSNGFTSEVPFGLVDTGATDTVGFDILPYPLVGVEFRRISRELEQAQLSMGRSHEDYLSDKEKGAGYHFSLPCFRPVAVNSTPSKALQNCSKRGYKRAVA